MHQFYTRRREFENGTHHTDWRRRKSAFDDVTVRGAAHVQCVRNFLVDNLTSKFNLRTFNVFCIKFEQDTRSHLGSTPLVDLIQFSFQLPDAGIFKLKLLHSLNVYPFLEKRFLAFLSDPQIQQPYTFNICTNEKRRIKNIRLFSEATPGLEPGNKSFADSPLTNLGTSPCDCNYRKYFVIFQGDDAQTPSKKTPFLHIYRALAPLVED